MTHATIHHIDSVQMAVEFAFDAAKKDAVAAMIGATWDKPATRWSLPVARLGDVVKLFWPDVTIDYAVLVARDEQLRRMFRQYRAAGVAFSIENGGVRCDNAALDACFLAKSTAMHVAALECVMEERAPSARPTRAAAPLPAADPMLNLLLTGIGNAQRNEERKAAMLAGQKRKRSAGKPAPQRGDDGK